MKLETRNTVHKQQLLSMSLNELRALKARIEDAIRAGIRAQKAGTQGHGQAPAPATPPAVTVSDLERERDAWLSARK